MIDSFPVMGSYVVHYTPDGVEWNSFEFGYDCDAPTIDVELEAQRLLEEQEGAQNVIYECLPKY